MNQKNLPAITEAIEKAREQFEKWRATKKKRSPIPELLWETAVKLCKDLSVNKVARTLRLDYYALKKRVLPSDSAQKPVEDIRPSFVELNVPKPTVSSEWIVEMENPQGAKMKIQLKGQGGVDLVASLLSTFWSQ